MVLRPSSRKSLTMGPIFEFTFVDLILPFCFIPLALLHVSFVTLYPIHTSVRFQSFAFLVVR